MKHPSSQQLTPPKDGLYWVKLTPNDTGEPMRWSHGEFRLGAMVRPWYSWEPTDQTDTRSSSRLWPARYEGKK